MKLFNGVAGVFGNSYGYGYGKYGHYSRYGRYGKYGYGRYGYGEEKPEREKVDAT